MYRPSGEMASALTPVKLPWAEGFSPWKSGRAGAVWVYKPRRHKTQHYGKGRCIFIGPKAQEILRPWLRAGGGARTITLTLGVIAPARLNSVSTASQHPGTASQVMRLLPCPSQAPPNRLLTALVVGPLSAPYGGRRAQVKISAVYAASTLALSSTPCTSCTGHGRQHFYGMNECWWPTHLPGDPGQAADKGHH